MLCWIGAWEGQILLAGSKPKANTCLVSSNPSAPASALPPPPGLTQTVTGTHRAQQSRTEGRGEGSEILSRKQPTEELDRPVLPGSRKNGEKYVSSGQNSRIYRCTHFPPAQKGPALRNITCYVTGLSRKGTFIFPFSSNPLQNAHPACLWTCPTSTIATSNTPCHQPLHT